eukprot:TRINITY_DN2553_c0_g1_i1.p1 TRINITY_DN2553_c0_g1~~TRINITY_DN2553_c0_g1_i1.p1  ORF type:complete len:205 (-),score=27.89 TRINITY_DN2553_c0_g1_i1:34-648(-)
MSDDKSSNKVSPTTSIGEKHTGTPSESNPRLIQIKGRDVNRYKFRTVDVNINSLNSGDVFMLDLGETIFVFQGSKCQKAEIEGGRQLSSKLKDHRKGASQILVFRYDDDPDEDSLKFWSYFGDRSFRQPIADPTVDDGISNWHLEDLDVIGDAPVSTREELKIRKEPYRNLLCSGVLKQSSILNLQSSIFNHHLTLTLSNSYLT